MTNQEYFARFVEILNAHPESVRLLLKNYNVDAIGKPTIDDIKRANSTKLIEEIFLIEENKDSANYAIGWLTIASTAVGGILGLLGKQTDTSRLKAEAKAAAAEAEAKAKAVKAEAEAKAKADAEARKKQLTNMLMIGGGVLLLIIIAFSIFFFKSKMKK